MKKFMLYHVLLFAISVVALAQTPSHASTGSSSQNSLTDEVDRYIQAEMQKRRIPGLALAVVKEGKVVKAKGYGVASLEHEVPVTPQTVFAIALLDKQLTATAVIGFRPLEKKFLAGPLWREMLPSKSNY